MYKILLLFFSIFIYGECIFAQVDHWETLVYENNTWKYLVPTTTVTTSWNTLGYVDASWLSGTGGFGYGDGDDNTNISSTISVYQRFQFTIIDTSKLENLILNADYDDAYVAYINGTEISRANITSAGSPAYNQTADGNHEAVIYSGGYPDQIIINKSVWKYFLTNGTNVLCIQTHNTSAGSSDLSSRYWLHAGIKDATIAYGPTPSWFIPPFNFSSSNLPIVVINTSGIPIPDEPKLQSTMGIIYNGPGIRNYMTDPFNNYNGNIGIEIRGSSSSSFPKKSYGFETLDSLGIETSATLLGMPAESDWVLSASYTDKSLMNNVLSYYLFNQMGMYAPRTKFVEVVINDQYQGVYILMEKIKKDNNRVNISTLNTTDTSGLELTGGYILKIDKSTGSGGGGFTSLFAPPNASTQTIYFQYEYPSDITIQPQQSNYIQNFVNTFENALYNNSPYDLVNGWRIYADEMSFINYYILNELSKNVDGYRLSTYLYKTKATADNKIHLGPPWDYDIAWANADYCNGSVVSGWAYDFNYVCGGDYYLIPFWWEKLMNDTIFINNLKCTYNYYRNSILDTSTLFAHIDSMATYLEEAQIRNFITYPILGSYVWPNPSPIPTTYAGEVAELKNWINNRLNWLDNNIPGTCIPLSENENSNTTFNIKIYPNPFEDNFTLIVNSLENCKAKFNIKTIEGKTILTKTIELKNGNNTIYISEMNNFSNGIYLLELAGKDNIITSKIIKN